MPILIEIEKATDGYVAGRFMRAKRLARYRDVENGDWKLLVFDQSAGDPRAHQSACSGPTESAQASIRANFRFLRARTARPIGSPHKSSFERVRY